MTIKRYLLLDNNFEPFLHFQAQDDNDAYQKIIESFHFGNLFLDDREFPIHLFSLEHNGEVYLVRDVPKSVFVRNTGPDAWAQGHE